MGGRCPQLFREERCYLSCGRSEGFCGHRSVGRGMIVGPAFSMPEPAFLATLQTWLHVCLLCSNHGGSKGTFSPKSACLGRTSLSAVTEYQFQNRP